MDIRTGLTEEEVETLAIKLGNKIVHCTPACLLTQEQQNEIISILASKKRAVRVTLWLAGAMILWILKDVYLYIKNSIVWVK